MRTYFKSEEAPLCRFEFRLITTSRGDGISPKLSKNLHKVRRVGTLSTVQFKTVELKKEEVFPSDGEKLTYSPPSRNTFCVVDILKRIASLPTRRRKL